jgi:hypothetical protein
VAAAAAAGRRRRVRMAAALLVVRIGFALSKEAQRSGFFLILSGAPREVIVRIGARGKTSVRHNAYDILMFFPLIFIFFFATRVDRQIIQL